MRGVTGNALGRQLIYVIVGFSILVVLAIAMAVSLMKRPEAPQPKALPLDGNANQAGDIASKDATPNDGALPEPVPEPEPEPIPPPYEEPEPPPVVRKFLPVTVDGIEGVKFGMNVEEMDAALGEPDTITEKGQRIHLKRGMIVELDADGELARIICLGTEAAPEDIKGTIKPFAGKTPEGIGLGATTKEIVMAYGPPDLGRKDLEMDLPEMRLQYFRGDYVFMITDGKLVKFTVTPPIKQSY